MPVTINGEEIRIEPFKGYKGIRGGQLFGRVSSSWPQILDNMAEYRRTYGEKHYRRITRAMAETRSIPEQVTDEQAAEMELTDEQRRDLQDRYDRTAAVYQRMLEGELSTKDYVDLPEVPSQTEIVFAVFEDAFKVAQKEVVELLALLITANRDLKKAYKESGEEGVNELLKERGEDLLFDADLEELFALAVEGFEVLRKQLDWGAESQVGKLLSRFGLVTPTTTAPAQTPSSTPTETSSTSPSTSTSPDSSTDSPAPTDGAPSESSSALAGVSSAS